MRRRRRIDPAADRPIYKQLADIIRGDIRAGRLRPGQTLPSEGHLQQEYEVSLNSVRGALGILRSEGLLVTVRGRGTRVRQPEDVKVVKVPPGAVITARPCTEAEAHDYEIPEGTWVFVIEYAGRTELHRADGTKLQTTTDDSPGK